MFGIGSVPCFWPDYGLPLAFAFIAGALTLWYSVSIWRIDPNEELDKDGRMPLAFASFMRSLGYLAWMFISVVYVAAVPKEQIWIYSGILLASIPIINFLLISWKNSANKRHKF